MARGKRPLIMIEPKVLRVDIENWMNWCVHAKLCAFSKREGRLGEFAATTVDIEKLNRVCFHCAHRLGRGLDREYCVDKKFEKREVT